jgi:hypothetical protein
MAPIRSVTRNPTLHELEGAYRLAKLLSLVHVCNREVKCSLHQSV